MTSSSNAAPQPAASQAEKKLFAADLSLGMEAADVFILASAQQGQARNGPYWRLEFKDATGSISGKIWSPHSQAFPELSAGMAVWVRGRVTSYRDKLELSVEDMRVLDEEEKAGLNLALFMPASRHDPEAMIEEILELARKHLHHKPWRKFITGLLNDGEIRAALRRAPAAKAMHHAFAGGLIEHTLSVTRLCLRIADHYPHLDRQALFAGAVCHDLGKIWELTSGLAIDYTTSGRLIGHISLLMDRLAPFIKKSGLESDLAEHLEHLILSHHGTHEFGSPRLPATAEALVLHYADNIDAKLQQVSAALDGVEEGGWSAFNPGLERFLFRARQSPDSPAHAKSVRQSRDRSPDADPDASARQGQPLSLFD